jgi:hypothetical protein
MRKASTRRPQTDHESRLRAMILAGEHSPELTRALDMLYEDFDLVRSTVGDRDERRGGPHARTGK